MIALIGATITGHDGLLLEFVEVLSLLREGDGLSRTKLVCVASVAEFVRQDAEV